MDLSFPEGSSVNDGIPKDTYLGDPFKLHYPATDNLIHLMNRHGPGCLLYKVDIKLCYRWIPVDPTTFTFLACHGRIRFILIPKFRLECVPGPWLLNVLQMHKCIFTETKGLMI